MHADLKARRPVTSSRRPPVPFHADTRQPTARYLPAALAFFAIALVACKNPAPSSAHVATDTLPGGILRVISTSPVDSGSWSLVPDRTIQPPELDAAELLQPRDVAVASDGSVLVSEQKPAHIKVFDAAGRYVRSIGREGSGPGEFRVGYIAVRGDTLAVQDPANARATIFNWRTGALIGERRTACCYWSPIAFDGSGRVVVRATTPAPDTTWRHAQAFVRFALTGTSADTVFVLEGQDRIAGAQWLVREGTTISMAVAVPHQPAALYAVDRAGSFVTGWTSDYTLRVSQNGRDTTLLFGRHYQPSRLSADDKQHLVDSRVAGLLSVRRETPEAAIRAAFDPALIPDFAPAFDGISIDGRGRRWVRRVVSDTSFAILDLFDRDGRWLDAVRVDGNGWPRTGMASVAWSDDEAAVLLDGPDGRPLVRVYRVQHRAAGSG